MSFILLGILNSQAAAGNIPASLNPDLWLDAADATTITESGGSVSQWDNKGTLENFTQATSASQPTTGVSTLNGLNVIDFNRDFLTGATTSQWTFMHDGTVYFIAAVIKIGNTANPGTNYNIIGTSAGSSLVKGFFFAYDDRSNTDVYVYGMSNGTNKVVLVDDNGFITPNQNVISSQFLDPNNATAADRISYFKNDTEGTDTNTVSNSPTSSDSPNNLQVGATGNGVAPLVGSIAELIVVSGADATEENRQTVVDYLNDKWGVF